MNINDFSKWIADQGILTNNEYLVEPFENTGSPPLLRCMIGKAGTNHQAVCCVSCQLCRTKFSICFEEITAANVLKKLCIMVNLEDTYLITNYKWFW